MKKTVINKNDANKRLDKFITKSFPKIPESLLYKYIRTKRIKVNGKKSENSAKLKEGDVIELYINDELLEKLPFEEDFKKAPSNLDIIYEDNNVLLVNKKPGLIVHPDKDFQTDCLINRIKNYLFQKGEYDPVKENSFAPALVNRIDRNTSGIVLAVKNAEALNILNQKMKLREIGKSYVCVVIGKMEKKSDTLKGYLEKNHEQNKVYIKSSKLKNDDSKTIVTKYKVIDSSKNFSLLEVDLLTGRTHQIRAHLASIGHAILGDGKYGKNDLNRSLKYKYQALCSYKLKFDFQSDASTLNYLKGKIFEIELGSVWFVKDFYENLL
jgi:23S rRNA pseudouridine955/2504/2580 synthase